MPTWSLPLASESQQMALGVIGMVRFEVPDFSEILSLTFSYTNFQTKNLVFNCNLLEITSGVEIEHKI